MGVVIAITLAVYSLIRRGANSVVSALLGACVTLFLFPHEYFRSSHGELYHSLTSILAFALYFLGQRTRWSLLGVGVLFMAGFCVKQTAIFDIGAFLAIHGLYHRNLRKSIAMLEKPACAPAISWISELGWIALGSGMVAACSVAYFAAHGSLREAVYGTFLDAFIYATGKGIDNTLSRYAKTCASELAFLSQMHWILLASLAASSGCLFVRRQGR